MKTRLTALVLTLWSLAGVAGAQDTDAFYKGVQAYRAHDYILAASWFHGFWSDHRNTLIRPNKLSE